MIYVLLLHHNLWTNFLSAKKNQDVLIQMPEWQCEWPSCAPFFSARSEMNFHARKSKLDFSVIAEVVGSNAPRGRLSNNTLHLSARRIVKTSGRAQRRQSCSNRIHMLPTFPYILFFFMSRNCQQCMAHPPRSRNATGAGAYGTSMRNNLAEVSVSLQSVMRWYCESWKTPGT